METAFNREERQALRAKWQEEENAAFSGWDFGHITSRMRDAVLPWSYRDLLLERLSPEKTLLDMGTGGGEFLLGLGHPHGKTTVTEAWQPNYELCMNTLAPLGIGVAHVNEEECPLPFADSSFDVVANRHESFCAREIARVLRPGGVFLTQQVGGENDQDLVRLLCPGVPVPYPGHNLARNRELLAQAGLAVDMAEEHFGTGAFFDTGAVVYFAKVLPWEFPGFTVAGSFEALLNIEAAIRRDGAFPFTEHRFLLAARRIE